MEKLLLMDVAETFPAQFTAELQKEYNVLQVADYTSVVAQCSRFEPNVILFDLGSSPGSEDGAAGFHCLQLLLAVQPDSKVVVVMGEGDRETAQKALRCGAYDYYLKPVHLIELMVVIRRAFRLSEAEQEQLRLETTLARREPGLDGIVGQCSSMQRIFSAVRMVAASDVAVLITGESGTGKELLARTIKSLSARSRGPFVPVKCDSIAKDLLDCELFGREPEAGPGAKGPVPGKLEQAGKGIIFLDEPAELPLQLQLRLLQALREGVTTRVGGTEIFAIDARIICAASARRVPAMRAGGLLKDLYARIAVDTLELPPLRARGEDIMLLAHLFLRRFAQACNSKARGFSPAAVCALESHPWPGNVRELEGRVQRGVVMSDGPLLEPGALGLSGAGTGALLSLPGGKLSLREARIQVERKVISMALAASRGNLVKASELLGISRSTLYDLLKRHGLFHAEVRQ
jgi:two-component system, NtrC family, response regulator